MSEKEENGCRRKSCRRQCKGPRARTHCPRYFCTQGTEGCGTADSNQKDHHHASGACPFLEKLRLCGCSGEENEKKSGCESMESVPQECATWMCWYYYTMGRNGSYQQWGQYQGGFVPPSFGDSESSESDESAEQEGMETEAVSSEIPDAETKVGDDATTNDEKKEGDPNKSDTKDPVPVEFLQWACWAYYMLGTNEAGGPPHMGPWGQQFGPRPLHHEMSGYGPFGHRGDFGHHHHGPPPFGPFGRHPGHHGHHGHGPPFLFPGMGGFGGMFGFPSHGDRRRRHCHGGSRGGDRRRRHCHGGSRGGPCRGRGGFRGGHGGPPCCQRMCKSKGGKEDTTQETK